MVDYVRPKPKWVIGDLLNGLTERSWLSQFQRWFGALTYANYPWWSLIGNEGTMNIHANWPPSWDAVVILLGKDLKRHPTATHHLRQNKEEIKLENEDEHPSLSSSAVEYSSSWPSARVINSPSNAWSATSKPSEGSTSRKLSLFCWR